MLVMLDGNERPDCESGRFGSTPNASTNLRAWYRGCALVSKTKEKGSSPFARAN